jgi:Uncharacterized conserved protein (DUF2163)
MSDYSYSILSSEDVSYSFIITISRPDGIPYKVFTTDQLDGDGDMSSIASSASFNTPPVNFSNVLTVSLPMRLILCRQVSGWPVKVDIKMTFKNGISETKTMFQARIGEITIQGNKANIELLSPNKELTKPSRYTLNTSCTREFGDSKCEEQIYPAFLTVNSLVGTILSVNFAGYIFEEGIPYACVIGDDTYLISSINTALSELTLNRRPLGKPDVVEVRRTCDRKITTCRRYSNTHRFLGSKLPANALSITL